MADNEKLQLGLSLQVDLDAFEAEWKNKQAAIQKIINGHTFDVKIGGIQGLAEVQKEIENFSRGMRASTKVDLVNTDSIKGLKDEIRALEITWSGLSEAQKYANKETGQLTEFAASLAQRYGALTTQLKEYGLTLKETTKDQQKLAQAQQDVFDSLRKDAYQSMGQQDFGIAQLNEYYRQLEESSRLAKEVSDAEAQRGATRFRESQRIQAEKARELQLQQEEYEALRKQLREEAKLASLQKNRRDNERYTSQQRRISEGKRIQQILTTEAKTLDAINQRLAIQRQRLGQATIGSAQYKKIEKDIAALEARLRSLGDTQRRSTGITDAQTNAFQRQSGVLNGLKQFMNSYISLLGGYRLMSNIKQITSEFELQRVSLRAITQDAQFADALFAKIKVTATESPFSTKDLVTYTKQLAAYRIENEQLYGTMNMLADVSAGLGVSMDRLILAYGQVKAASVLRGTELRQFTEAGIPLVDELAKKFSQLRGEVVSTGEVFDLISEREVPFEMVADIFKEMTAEGGRFYEMQKKQSESLYGVYENLKDNIQNAYDEMGQSNRGLLMGIGKTLTALAQNLHGISSLLTPLIAGFGAWHLGLKLIGSESSKMVVANALLLKTEKELNRSSLTRIQLLRQIAPLMANARAANNKYAISTLRAAAANTGLVRTFYRLKAALLANPITAIITGLVTLGAAIYAIVKYESPYTKMMNKIKDTTQELSSNAEASSLALDNLLGKLKSAQQGSQEYADIIGEINRRYGEFLPEQLKVSQSYDKIAESVKGVKTALMEKARAEAYSAGITEIETHFAEQLKEAYKDITSALRGQNVAKDMAFFNLDEKGAQKVFRDVLSVIKNNPEVAVTGNVIGQTLRNSLKEALKMSDSEVDSLMFWTKGLEDKFKKIAKSYSSLNDDLESHIGALDAMFGQPYTKEVDAINDKYEALKEAINSKSYADDKEGKSVLRKQELLEAEGARLNDLIRLYTQYEQFDLAMKTQEQLNKLLKVGDAWQVAVDKIIDENQTLSKYNYKEDDNIFSYAETLQKAYKKIQEQIDLDLKLTEAQKKKLTDEMAGLKSLAAAIGLDFKKTKTQKDIIKEQVDTLKSEFSLVEKIYKRYEDLQKLMSQKAAKGMVEDTYKNLTKIDFLSPQDLKKRLQSLLKQVEALGKDGRELAIQIGLAIQDINTNEIKDKLERALSRLSNQIKQQQDASDFFEKMLGLTGDVELSTKLTLGVTGVELQEGGVSQLLVQQLAEILTMSPIAAAVPTDFVIDGKWDSASVQKAIQEGELTVSQIQKVIANLTAMGKDDLAKSLEGALASFVDYNKQLVNEVYSTLAEYGDFADKIELIKAQTDVTTKVRPPEVDDAAWAAYTAALQRKQDEAVAAINFDKFKKEFAKQLSNLDIVASMTLDTIRQKLVDWMTQNAGKASEADVKAVLELIEKIDNIKVSRNPFKEWWSAWEDLNAAKKKGDTEAIEEAFNKLKAVSKVSSKAIANMSNAIISTVDSALELADALGITFSDDTLEIIDAFKKGLKLIAPIMTAVGVSMIFTANAALSLQAALWPLLAITVGLAAIFATISWISGDKVRKANKEIARQEEELRRLERAYKSLEEAQADLVGSDWIRNQRDQIANLQDQVTAFQAQLDAEDSKGKKKDSDAIEDYTDKILDAQEQIRALKKEIVSEMTGTSLPDAAKDFAQSWLDAYLSFDDTMGALKASFKDMMKTMVQNSMMAKLVQKRLEPVFAAIDKAYEDAELTPAEWQSIMDMGNKAIEFIDEDLTHLAEMLGLRSQLGEQDTSNLTGIAKGVAQASEETVLTLAGYANSILYYQVWIKDDVAAIRAILEGKAAAVAPSTGGDSGFNVGQLVTLQQQSLSQLQAINANTGNTVSQLQTLNDKIDSIISTAGTSSRKVVNTRFSN